MDTFSFEQVENHSFGTATSVNFTDGKDIEKVILNVNDEWESDIVFI